MFVAGRIRGVSVTGGGSTQHITFTCDLAPAPCTITTSAPFRAPGRHAFEVAMRYSTVEWVHGDAAYPAISNEGGTVKCTVRCISNSHIHRSTGYRYANS